jgi:hypothetical protein
MFYFYKFFYFGSKLGFRARAALRFNISAYAREPKFS